MENHIFVRKADIFRMKNSFHCKYRYIGTFKCIMCIDLIKCMPKKVLLAVASGKIHACATTEIVNECNEIVEEIIQRKQGHLIKTY